MIAAQWEDYWASGGSSERALGAAAQREFLTQHWATVFATHARATPMIVDVACGDGAVFTCVHAQLAAREGATLIALDAAPAAVRAATRANKVLGAAADACRLPLRDGAADIVASQFGLEYGGGEAFDEAARIVGNGGVMSAICHLKGGAIDAECKENARILQAFADARLSERAHDAFAETYTGGADTFLSYGANTEAGFHRAMQHVTDVLRMAPESAAKAMVSSAVKELATLASRRLAYDVTEALTFVDHITSTLAAYSARMGAMLAAALDRHSIGQIAQRLGAAGMIDFSADQVAIAPGRPPSAWRIAARRRG